MSGKTTLTLQTGNTLEGLAEDQEICGWSAGAKMEGQKPEQGSGPGKLWEQRLKESGDQKVGQQKWSREEENRLYALQDQFGSKWSMIAHRIPGRTDRCIKNHFYSQLRKAVRKLNKTIYNHFRREIKEIKVQVIYKLVEAANGDSKGRQGHQHAFVEMCARLKRNLLQYSSNQQNIFTGNFQKLKQLAQEIHDFSAHYAAQGKDKLRLTSSLLQPHQTKNCSYQLNSACGIESQENNALQDNQNKTTITQQKNKCLGANSPLFLDQLQKQQAYNEIKNDLVWSADQQQLKKQKIVNQSPTFNDFGEQVQKGNVENIHSQIQKKYETI